MTGLVDLYIAALVAAAFSGVVIAVLHRPLYRVILDLCGTKDRAVFWTAYVDMLLVLVPVLSVSYLTVFGPGLLSLDEFTERAIFYALVGVTAALLAIGWGIWLPSNRLAKDETQARGRWQSDPLTD